MSDSTTTSLRANASRAGGLGRHAIPFVLFAVLLVTIPLFGPSRGTQTLINLMGINIVLALSYNMLLGRAGLLSFGHAVYFGLGGFFCVHVMNWIASGDGVWAHVPVFSLPLFGFAMGALVGAVIGWPSCRRSGTAFAMISLGIAELIAAGAYLFDSLFGGEVGIAGDRMSGPRFAGLSLGPLGEVYWFIAFWTFVAVAGMYAFTRTPLGQLGEATRDNPERVQFVGYDPMRIRYLVFIFASAFAGMAGGMAAVQNEIFTITSFSMAVSGSILISAYLGGTRYFVGPIIGAVFLTYLRSSLSDYTHAWLLYVGLLFIAVVMFAPNGIAGILFGIWRGIRSPDPRDVVVGWSLRTVAGLLVLVSVVVCAEVAVRWSQGYGAVFTPFGVPLPHDSVLTWVLVLISLAAGTGLLRRLVLRERAKR